MGRGWQNLGRVPMGAVLASILVMTGSSAGGPIRGEGGDRDAGVKDVDDGSFGFTPPIACKEIKGYEDYEPMEEAVLTKDEKLLVYFRPRHYKTDRVGNAYEARFTQEGRIRRRGEKAVLWSKKDLLEYTARSETPPRLIYLRNTVALKQLKPGEYDFDIILRDAVGRSAPAVRTLPFTVIAAPDERGTAKKGGRGNPGPP